MKIKYKLIRRTKIHNRQTLENLTIQAVDYANDVRMAIERKFRIVQLDECFVTRNTIPKLAWSMKKMNIELDNKSLDINAISIIAAVSREYGLDHIELFDRSITKIKFKIFLEGLRSKYPFDNILLVMD